MTEEKVGDVTMQVRGSVIQERDQECRHLLECEKGKETDLSLQLTEPCQHCAFSPVKPMLDF